MKAATYSRVSTLDQNPDLQVRELREFVARRGWDLAGEYQDHGESGAKTTRPELDRLMRDAGSRRFGVVVVWKFDRFGRSMRHLIETLEQFHALGIEFVSVTEAIDTSTPSGKMVYQILAVLAEFERDLIRERVRAGVAAAKARLRSGPYRVTRGGQDRLVTGIGRPRVAADPHKIAALRAAGWSWKHISRELGIGKGTAQRAYYSLPKTLQKTAPVTR